VKGEHIPTCGGWIELISEAGFDAGAFVRERQRITPFRVDIEQAFAVFVGLLFDAY
jgi:hypothetical protein